MKAFFTAIALMTAFVLSLAAPADADTRHIKRGFYDAEGNLLFRCGDINQHRQVGLVHPGTTLTTVSPVISSTGDLRDLNKQQQAFVSACNNAIVIEAGRVAPMLNVSIGAGVTRHVGNGGGNTIVEGSSAIAGANADSGSSSIAKSAAHGR